MATENKPKLHFLIEKQLKRANLEENDIPPNKRYEWNNFLSRVSSTYADQEQERYLLERSLDISSREMMDLNEKLEFAHKIAHLGYWIYDKEEDKLTWSKETFYLAGMDPAEGTPPLEAVIELVHEEDRDKLKESIERAFSEGKDFELELRFLNKKENKYYWHFTKAHPHIHRNDNKDNADQSSIRYLSGIAMDITERKRADESLKEMHQKLLSISRQAGMAEVATSVLHNIGNILNSANVSIAVILETVKKARVDKLIKVSQMILEHLTKKDDYLINDEKGKLIPDYLLALTKKNQDEYKEIATEIKNIENHLHHIKDIVALQKDISGISGVKEKIIVNEVVDQAIHMGCSSTDAKEIEIIKNYQYKSSVFSERTKLLQILVNLIRNAKDSVTHYSNVPRKITINIKKMDNDTDVAITVTDNGCGIAAENITKIFSLGFTTKPNGHGFGLHSSAIAATELGGILRAESEGEGKGATFIVELPLSNEKVKNEMDLMQSK